MKKIKQKIKKKIIALVIIFNLFSTTAQTVTTIAGSGSGSADFADGIGILAQFQYPYNATVDNNGNIIITDSNNSRIRKISTTGVVSTIAGSNLGFADGIGTSAQFFVPCGVAVDVSGNIFIADRNNHRIRKITTTNIVSTIAGSVGGFADGIGSLAKFNAPSGIAIDISGNIFIADAGNNRIRKISTSGVVTTISGSTAGYNDGAISTARFNYPTGVAVDITGNLYIADPGNNRIRKISTTGIVSTLAGNGNNGTTDGVGTLAEFNYPIGIAVSSGNIFVADTNNNRIRKITSTGIVTTFAGSSSGYVDGTGTNAKFYSPYGLTIDAEGNIIVVDSGNNRIRKINNVLANNKYEYGDNISIYPNPFRKEVNIDLINFEETEVNIFDINGRKIKTKNLLNDKNLIALDDLDDGIYLFQIFLSDIRTCVIHYND